MKKILILLAVVCCCGCSNAPQKEVKTDISYRIGVNSSVRYVEFDGHQFIEYSIGGELAGGSLCHSPNCSCLEQFKK